MSSRIIRSAMEVSRGVRHFTFAPAFASPATPAATQIPDVSNDAGSTPSLALTVLPFVQPPPTELLFSQRRVKVPEIEKVAYETGFTQGQKAAAEAGEKMVEAVLKQYAVSLEELNRLRKDVFVSSERQVIRLALEIAKKIIKREVTIDEDLILTLVKVALARVADQSLVTIRVNPSDYQSIERHRAAGPDAASLGETVKLIEDPLVGRGGCVIETDSGTIDARIEEQLKEIEKGFFE